MSLPQVREAGKSPIRFFLFFHSVFSCSLAVVNCAIIIHHFLVHQLVWSLGFPRSNMRGSDLLTFCSLKVTECVYLSCSSITRRSWTCLTAHVIQRLETGSPTLRSMRMGAEGSTPQEWPHGWSAQRRRSAICPLRPRPASLSSHLN